MAEITFAQLPGVIDKTLKDFKFAGVLALTWTAKDAQKAVRVNLDKTFTLRNTWTARGIRIIAASKTNMTAEVYSKDWYIAEHEEGKRRTIGAKVKKKFFIPTREFYSTTGVDKKRRIPKRYRPGHIMKTKIRGELPFFVKFKSGFIGAAVRGDKKRLPITALYKIQEEPVTIDRRYFFQPVIETTFDKQIDFNYEKALKKVMGA